MPHQVGHLRKERQTASDHRFRCGQADAEVSRDLHDVARQDKHVAIRQGVPESIRVCAGAFAEQIKGSFRSHDPVSRIRERIRQPCPPLSEGWHIDAEPLQIGDGVLHDGIREAPAERHLGGEQTLLKRLPLGFGHQGRQGQIAQPLTRCEQHLAVAIGDQGPGIDRSRADELPPVKADAAVGLIREEEDAPPDALRGAVQKVRQGRKARRGGRCARSDCAAC